MAKLLGDGGFLVFLNLRAFKTLDTGPEGVMMSKILHCLPLIFVKGALWGVGASRQTLFSFFRSFVRMSTTPEKGCRQKLKIGTKNLLLPF